MSSRKAGDHSVGENPFQAILRREELLATIDSSDFPVIIENELLSANDMDPVFSAARRWAKRDSEGYIAWLKTKSWRFMMREQGYGHGLTDHLIDEMVKHDPK
ncbi:MAG: hypothetical protein QNL80_14345 [Akkermansiaceae bacterium]